MMSKSYGSSVVVASAGGVVCDEADFNSSTWDIASL